MEPMACRPVSKGRGGGGADRLLSPLPPPKLHSRWEIGGILTLAPERTAKQEGRIERVLMVIKRSVCEGDGRESGGVVSK